jgi:hypothetical protein
MPLQDGKKKSSVSTVNEMFFFSDGVVNKYFTCPDGYAVFIDTCVNISSPLPAATSYAGAVASCLASGQQILTTENLYLKEAVRSYLNNTGVASNIWISPVAGERSFFFVNVFYSQLNPISHGYFRVSFLTAVCILHEAALVR